MPNIGDENDEEIKMDFIWIVVGIFIVFLILKQLFYYFDERSTKLSPEEQTAHDKEQERQTKARHDIFNSLTDKEIKKMTLSQIEAKVGNGCSRVWVMTFMQRRKLDCVDYDGSITSEERSFAKKTIGTKNSRLICPHCQEKGGVYKKLDVTRREETRDSTNVTAAILKGVQTTTKKVTQLHCVNCDTSWDI